jgi:hypothetical protein
MDKSQEQISKAIQAKECQDYLATTVKAIREDLYRMLSESPDKAVEAHYITLALNKVYAKMQGDINGGKQAEREAK